MNRWVSKQEVTWMTVWLSPWEALRAKMGLSLCMMLASAFMSWRVTLKPAVVSTIATCCKTNTTVLALVSIL